MAWKILIQRNGFVIIRDYSFLSGIFLGRMYLSLCKRHFQRVSNPFVSGVNLFDFLMHFLMKVVVYTDGSDQEWNRIIWVALCRA